MFSPSRVKRAPTPWALKCVAAFRAASNPSPGRKRLTARWAKRQRGTWEASQGFRAHHRRSCRIGLPKTNERESLKTPAQSLRRSIAPQRTLDTAEGVLTPPYGAEVDRRGAARTVGRRRCLTLHQLKRSSKPASRQPPT